MHVYALYTQFLKIHADNGQNESCWSKRKKGEKSARKF